MLIGASYIGKCMNFLYYKFTNAPKAPITPQEEFEFLKLRLLGEIGEKLTIHKLEQMSYKVTNQQKRYEIEILPFELYFQLYGDGEIQDLVEDDLFMGLECKFVSGMNNVNKIESNYFDQVTILNKALQPKGISETMFTKLVKDYRGSDPSLHINIIPFNQDHYLGLEEKAIKLYEFVKNKEYPDYPTEKGFYCNSCSYRFICETLGKEQMLLPTKEIKQQISNLKAKQKEVKRELSKIKKEMKKYIKTKFNFDDFLESFYYCYDDKKNINESQKLIISDFIDQYCKKKYKKDIINTYNIIRELCFSWDLALEKWEGLDIEIENLNTEELASEEMKDKIEIYFKLEEKLKAAEGDFIKIKQEILEYMIENKKYSLRTNEGKFNLEQKKFRNKDLGVIPPELLQKCEIRKVELDYNLNLLPEVWKNQAYREGSTKYIRFYKK